MATTCPLCGGRGAGCRLCRGAGSVRIEGVHELCRHVQELADAIQAGNLERAADVANKVAQLARSLQWQEKQG